MTSTAQDPNASTGWKMFTWFLVLSLVLHLAFGTWMALTPNASTPIPGKQQPARIITASSAQIHKVVEQIRVRQADEVRDKVQELLDMQKALAAARTEKFEEYRQAAEAQEVGALEKALAAELLALPAQEKAVGAQQQVAPLIPQAITLWAEISSGADDASRKAAKEKYTVLRKEIGSVFEAAKQAQVEADTAAAEALRQLTFAPGDEVTPARQAQEAAVQAQAAANTAQDTTASTVDATSEMNWKLGELERDTGKSKGDAKNTRERAKSLEEQLTRLQKDLVVRESRVTEAAAKAEKSKAKGDLERVAKLKKETEDSQSKITAKIAELGTQQAKIEPVQKIADEKTAIFEKARQEIAAQLARGGDAQATASVAQSGGVESQKKAITILQALLAANAAKPAESGDKADEASPAAAQADAPGAAAIASTDLASKNFGELYEIAVNAEKSATADYRDIRAATVAVLTKKTLDEASRVTDLVQPTRASVESSLFSKDIGTAQDASSHTKAVRDALGELESMLSLSRKMFDTTINSSSSSSGSSEGVSVSLADSNAKSEQLAALEAEAKNDDTAQAKDLTELMKSGGKPGSDKPGSDKPSGGTASGPSRPAGSRPGSSGRGPVSSPNTIWPLAKGGTNSVPGRKVLSGGGSADWMFLDSWYIIGPFPNPARRNITTAFPPESVIDLDATYAGEDGKSLRWRFVQSPEAMVAPKQPGDKEQAIYYAYTELWMDQEMDAWLALASDDFGKVWLNDMPVWKSGTVAKPWVVDEAFRKVHFQKGINRVLFRVENCYRDVAFSVVVSTRKTEVSAP